MLSSGREGIDSVCLVCKFGKTGESTLVEGDVEMEGMGASSVVRARVEGCVGFP